ncbi:CopG family transcriptional regulator [Thiosulfativibrio zosterae]|uniref:CopG family transcriptional regulator n=1 Tax=Thiosulfativibrio zosterae TaxID=2675053 RepID=A0A6F8PQ92_9GAMM|nr:CopG family transcriptional regulator [Thiosulfativibrio zosterae]BBP44275.1 hypothetical protein THMIRHAT_20210 [Thiosulfativibrio zosterae]
MNFALRIPDYYKTEIEQLKGDVSINQFIINALGEKISALKTEEYLKARALKGSKDHALHMLDAVNNTPVHPLDEL